MKYRIRENLNGKFRAEYKGGVWPFWRGVVNSRFMGCEFSHLTDTIDESHADIAEMKEALEKSRKSKIWRQVWP